MSRKNKEFWLSGLTNNATYMQYYMRLLELSISMFEWVNMPKEIDTRFLELTLFSEGKALFFKDDVTSDYLGLQFSTEGGQFNVYRIPINRRAFAVNGYQNSLNDKNSVIIWNNMVHTPSMLDVKMFAMRLYNIDRAIDVNVNAQKTPILITCSPEERLTMENLYKEYDGNIPVIFAKSGLNPKNITCLKTDAPFVSNELYTLKAQIWNEALTYLGISNINTTKKERLITDEVTRNLGGVIASRQSRLNERRNACKLINDMFGLNTSVKYREDFELSDEDDILNSEEETQKVSENK